jgi:hypothetical protein
MGKRSRTDVENMIIALAQAGDQVRSFNEAKTFAAKVSADVPGKRCELLAEIF